MNPQSVPPESLLSSDAPSSSSAASDSSSISFPPLPVRVLDEYDLRSPRRRRALPLFLFLATCFFTYAAGTYRWVPTVFGLQIDPTHGEYWDLGRTFKQLATNWHDGLIYMSCVMAVLLAHEMGHFLMTVRYRIPASYPIFIPVPLMLTGTMGAVIGMEGFRANRRQMFDIGLAGPWAGLLLTVPLVCIGIKIAQPVVPAHGELIFGDPLLAKLLIKWLRPDLLAAGQGWTIRNPIYMAGWVGMFVTGLNMLPVSQLDGGHVIYSLFLRTFTHYRPRVFALRHRLHPNHQSGRLDIDDRAHHADRRRPPPHGRRQRAIGQSPGDHRHAIAGAARALLHAVSDVCCIIERHLSIGPAKKHQRFSHHEGIVCAPSKLLTS